MNESNLESERTNLENAVWAAMEAGMSSERVKEEMQIAIDDFEVDDKAAPFPRINRRPRRVPKAFRPKDES